MFGQRAAIDLALAPDGRPGRLALAFRLGLRLAPKGPRARPWTLQEQRYPFHQSQRLHSKRGHRQKRASSAVSIWPRTTS